MSYHSDLDYSSIPEVAPHQLSDYNLMERMCAPRKSVYNHPATSVQSLREKIESFIPSVAKLLSNSMPPQPRPSFINCWTSTATSAQFSRTRVLNIQNDGTYTFWEEMIMEPETPTIKPAASGSSSSPTNGEAPKPRRLSLSGRRASLEPPKYRIRKSSGEWKLCINQGVTLILLKGIGTERSGECGEYEENASPRGPAGEKWTHEEPLSVEHVINDWSAVSEDSMTELLC